MPTLPIIHLHPPTIIILGHIHIRLPGLLEKRVPAKTLLLPPQNPRVLLDPRLLLPTIRTTLLRIHRRLTVPGRTGHRPLRQHQPWSQCRHPRRRLLQTNPHLPSRKHPTTIPMPIPLHLRIPPTRRQQQQQQQDLPTLTRPIRTPTRPFLMHRTRILRIRTALLVIRLRPNRHLVGADHRHRPKRPQSRMAKRKSKHPPAALPLVPGNER